MVSQFGRFYFIKTYRAPQIPNRKRRHQNQAAKRWQRNKAAAKILHLECSASHISLYSDASLNSKLASIPFKDGMVCTREGFVEALNKNFAHCGGLLDILALRRGNGGKKGNREKFINDMSDRVALCVQLVHAQNILSDDPTMAPFVAVRNTALGVTVISEEFASGTFKKICANANHHTEIFVSLVISRFGENRGLQRAGDPDVRNGNRYVTSQACKLKSLLECIVGEGKFF